MEALLALRELAEERVDLELLTPRPDFVNSRSRSPSRSACARQEIRPLGDRRHVPPIALAFSEVRLLTYDE
jgi:hypothetical protein